MKKLAFRLEEILSTKIIINDIPPYIFNEMQCVHHNDGHKKVGILGREARVIRLSSSTHIAYAFADSPDYIKSSSRLKTEVEILLASAKKVDDEIQAVKDRADSQTKRLIHNLKSLSAKISQEVFFVALQHNLMASHTNSINYLENQIKERPKEAAKALLSILRYSTAQDTEFVAFHKLNGDVGLLKKEHHKIHKILMSVFYLFFQDYTDKHVRIDVKKSELEGTFDYDSVHVCIYHLVENSAKYVKPGSSMEVYISKTLTELEIVFDMESLAISDDEVALIFTEGFSGRQARVAELNGSGIGLFLAKRMAVINGGNIVVMNGRPLPTDPKFARNKFTLSLPI